MDTAQADEQVVCSTHTQFALRDHSQYRSGQCREASCHEKKHGKRYCIREPRYRACNDTLWLLKQYKNAAARAENATKLGESACHFIEWEINNRADAEDD